MRRLNICANNTPITDMRTALITGGNKGIGLGVVKKLTEMNYYVILGSRNMDNGQDALRRLNINQKNVLVLKIDVSDEKSIVEASDRIKSLNIRLDVLINNAGILIDEDNINQMSSDIFNRTIKTNTLGPILVIQNFYKLMNESGRVINVSSGLGSLNSMGDESPAYSISKTALNAVTKQFAASLRNNNISVNSVSPGWVRTDMGGKNAPRSIEKGTETIIWLADEAPQNLTGGFFRDKKEIDW